MHIPDGFFDGTTSAVAGAAAVGTLAVAARRCRDQLGERQVPLAAVTAAFVFAAQMLNFPVASGTSGHLLGGVLAAVLVGPWAGALCVSVVLAVQSLLFADGGLSALGLNIVNMALVGCVGGYLVFRAIRAVMPDNLAGVDVAAGLAAFASVPLAAAAFVAEFAVGGTTGIDLADVAAAMVGTHALIGIGEGVITAAAVGAVLATRPDLVHGAEGAAPPLEVRTEPVEQVAA
jgi:cobalt/nickel transport system permease protein